MVDYGYDSDVEELQSLLTKAALVAMIWAIWRTGDGLPGSTAFLGLLLAASVMWHRRRADRRLKRHTASFGVWFFGFLAAALVINLLIVFLQPQSHFHVAGPMIVVGWPCLAIRLITIATEGVMRRVYW